MGRQTVARIGRPSVANEPVRIIGTVAKAQEHHAALPRNDELAAQFELLADLMELEGADGFRIAAYRRAATRILETGSSVAQLALDGRAKELQGIGKTIEQKIVEVVDDGEIHALTKRKAEVPVEVASFMRLPGLGPKTARRLWKELGITTVEALQGGGRGAAAARSRRPRAQVGGEDPRRARRSRRRPRARSARSSARCCRSCGRSRRRWPRTRPLFGSRSPARPAATARPSAIST